MSFRELKNNEHETNHWKYPNFGFSGMGFLEWPQPGVLEVFSGETWFIKYSSDLTGYSSSKLGFLSEESDTQVGEK